MFYGIMFLGGNRTCTTGTPNEITGRMSIACDLFAFKTRAERDAWVDKYRDDNKEKIAVTKSEIRKYRRGHTVEEMNEEIEMAERDAPEN
jgi:hypothetical protein